VFDFVGLEENTRKDKGAVEIALDGNGLKVKQV
jgi:hypothetical protein